MCSVLSSLADLVPMKVAHVDADQCFVNGPAIPSFREHLVGRATRRTANSDEYLRLVSVVQAELGTELKSCWSAPNHRPIALSGRTFAGCRVITANDRETTRISSAVQGTFGDEIAWPTSKDGHLYVLARSGSSVTRW